MMRIFFTVLPVFLLVFSVVFFSGVRVVKAAPTVVSINPVSQTVQARDMLSITVMCSPKQAVKAFELKVSFNPSLLQATSVVEGDIFDDFSSTFFNTGSIDNTVGTIVNIYDLIVGSGNVTETGSLVVINFTARSLNGTSAVSLYDVRVTNESDYLEVSVSSGTVTVTGGSNPSEYTITATVGTGGLIAPAGSILVNPGANQAFTITPNTGYSILDVRVDGVSAGTVSTYTFSNVVADHTIAASFAGNENPPPSEPPVNPPSSDNTPPSAPSQPVGLTDVGVGTVYSYSSAANDPDGDLVRLRFDWGDGSLSNWTAFVVSNTSVSASYAWINVSSYPIRVIAQDANGANSSWSDPLTVNVSQAASEGTLPVGMFTVPGNASTNQTIVFDTSGIYDPDGAIVSYQWDFGDGTTAVGKNPVHTYQVPGTYTVTLTVIDDSGLTVTFSKVVNIVQSSEAQTGNANNFFQSNSSLIILTAIAIPLIIILVVYRDRIEQVYVQKRIEASRRRLAFAYSDTSEIDQLLDTLFGSKASLTPTPSKEMILNAYSDLIVAKVEKNTTYHPPDLSIEEIEKLVDRRIQSKIEEKVDKL